VGYRWFDTKKVEVAYPFGFGLSYTDFGYQLESCAIEGDKVVARIRVKNEGTIAGREVVQAYVKAAKGSMPKPEKELKAFAKTKLIQPGMSEVVELSWAVADMASFATKQNAWELAKGDYTVLFAHDAQDIRCNATVKVAKKVLTPVKK